MPSTSFLGFGKSPPAATTQKGNGGMDHFDHTMAQMLDMVVNELQNCWDEQLPHIEFAHNNSVSAATGLAPNEIHMGRLPRPPLTIFERTGGRRPLELGPRPPRLLRLGDQPPAARVRYRP